MYIKRWFDDRPYCCSPLLPDFMRIYITQILISYVDPRILFHTERAGHQRKHVNNLG